MSSKADEVQVWKTWRCIEQEVDDGLPAFFSWSYLHCESQAMLN